jgi:hypothetical protein
MTKNTTETETNQGFSQKHFECRQRLDQLLKSPLTGWDRIFIRDLDRQWKICNRDGKEFKLSAKQSVNLQRIEKEVC